MFVIKADGKREIFHASNIVRSLGQVGVPQDVAEGIAADIQRAAGKTVRSDDVFRDVLDALVAQNPVWAGKYNLRRAIMQLGPTGFPFEQYVAEILRAYGYETLTDQFIRGTCVRHEIDVVARKPGRHFIVECKYHNTPGARSDVKVALYLWARFMDIKHRLETDQNHPKEEHGVWLVTNTRCTTEAIQYAQCMGMRVTGWGYPEGAGLEAMIHQKALYPINLFPFGQGRWMYSRFAEQGIYMLKDVVPLDPADLARRTNVPVSEIAFLQEQAKKLCEQQLQCADREPINA